MTGFKTVISNTVGSLAVWAGVKYGLDISPEMQLALVTIIMSVANLVLRWVTTTPIFTGK